MNCLQALAIAAAALVASGEPVLRPLTEAEIYIARGEVVMRSAAARLEARFATERSRRVGMQTPDAHIHAVRLL